SDKRFKDFIPLCCPVLGADDTNLGLETSRTHGVAVSGTSPYACGSVRAADVYDATMAAFHEILYGKPCSEFVIVANSIHPRYFVGQASHHYDWHAICQPG